jgi:hypothetical protein
VTAATGDRLEQPLLKILSQEPIMQLRSTITCPSCGHSSTETMPTDACQFFLRLQGLRRAALAQGRGLLFWLRAMPADPAKWQMLRISGNVTSFACLNPK